MSKINLILESLAQIREVEGDPAEALGKFYSVLIPLHLLQMPFSENISTT
jgi:hypothetical protein